MSMALSYIWCRFRLKKKIIRKIIIAIIEMFDRGEH